jgi:hypothetical protein
MKRLLLGLVLAVTLAGCGPSAEQVAAVRQACDNGQKSACIDYEDMHRSALSRIFWQRTAAGL